MIHDHRCSFAASHLQSLLDPQTNRHEQGFERTYVAGRQRNLDLLHPGIGLWTHFILFLWKLKPVIDRLINIFCYILLTFVPSIMTHSSLLVEPFLNILLTLLWKSMFSCSNLSGLFPRRLRDSSTGRSIKMVKSGVNSLVAKRDKCRTSSIGKPLA